MRVAFGSDEKTPLTDAVAADLVARGHELQLVGPPAGTDEEWAEVGMTVGGLVASGAADTAVLFCWTGTGASIAANKVHGVRAALCTDATTAEGARKWNDANVLVMGLRLTSEDDPVKIEADLGAMVPPEEWGRLSLRLIDHGRRVCDARKPRCGICGLAGICPSAGKFG